MNSKLLFFCAGIFLTLASCTKHTTKEVSNVERLSDTKLRLSVDAMTNVRLEKVEYKELPERLDLMGRISVTEDRTTVVPARVAGRIDSIYLASGEAVKKGQALASLFSPDFVSAREEYLQSLKQARSISSEDGSSDFATFSQLARKKLETMGLTQEDIDNLPRADELNKPNFLVRSPRSGIIIEKKALLGNLANVGDSLFTVADISKVWFSGDVYSEDLPRVRKNQQIIIDELPDGQTILGNISFISPIVDPTARTIKIRALMDNPGGLLRADMYVHGGIILSQKKALLVPTTAIIRGEDGEYTYREVEPQVFERVAVKTKEEFRNLTAVTDGLKEGETVMSEGGLFLDSALNNQDK